MRWRMSHEAAQFSDNLPVTTWVNKLEIPVIDSFLPVEQVTFDI